AAVAHQRVYREGGKALAAAEEGELKDERGGHDAAAELLEELRRGERGPAGGEHVVDEEDPLPGLDRVHVRLERVGPVLERVVDAARLERELARLAHRREAGPEVERDGRREDEATRLDADDEVDVVRGEVVGQLPHDGGEEVRVGEDRREVLELDPGLREVRDVAYAAPNPVRELVERRVRHPGLSGSRPRCRPPPRPAARRCRSRVPAGGPPPCGSAKRAARAARRRSSPAPGRTPPGAAPT